MCVGGGALNLEELVLGLEPLRVKGFRHLELLSVLSFFFLQLFLISSPTLSSSH